MTDYRCTNCGQPILSTDTVCWQCGEALSEHGAAEAQEKSEASTADAPVAALGLYLVLTVVAVVALLVIMGSLGRRPLVRVPMGLRPPDGWEFIGDADGGFTLALPVAWERLDGAIPVQRSALQELATSEDRFQRATLPLADAVNDLDLVFLAQSPIGEAEIMPAFLVIGRSPALNDVTFAEAISLLQNGEHAVNEAEMVENFDLSHLSIELELPTSDSGGDTMRCRQQFIKGEKTGILIAACAPAEQFGLHRAELDAILSNFQRLK